MIASQNTNAVLAMCAIVITCYTIRKSEAHYLPDLLGLALALAAPRQSLALLAWLVVTLIRHSPLALALAPNVPSWLLIVLLPRAYFMSRSEVELALLESSDSELESPAERNSENDDLPQRVGENDAEIVNSAKAEMMARAVLAGEIGLTEAVRLAAGARSGRRYQKWSRLIKLEMDRQRNHYPKGSSLKRFD